MVHTLTGSLPTPGKMVYSCPMHMTHLAGNNQPSAWTKALHLFYAGLYAFVLPFICWGAQATPGHPHARAHFVFVEPNRSDHRAAETATDQAAATETAEAEAITHADMAHHDAHPMAPTPAKPTKSPDQPVGRATPSMLGVTILLLIGGAAIQLPGNRAAPSFCDWIAPLAAAPFTALIPTPPPR